MHLAFRILFSFFATLIASLFVLLGLVAGRLENAIGRVLLFSAVESLGLFGLFSAVFFLFPHSRLAPWYAATFKRASLVLKVLKYAFLLGLILVVVGVIIGKLQKP